MPCHWHALPCLALPCLPQFWRLARSTLLGTPHPSSSVLGCTFGLDVVVTCPSTLECCQTSSSSVCYAFFSLLPCLLWYQELRGFHYLWGCVQNCHDSSSPLQVSSFKLHRRVHWSVFTSFICRGMERFLSFQSTCRFIILFLAVGI